MSGPAVRFLEMGARSSAIARVTLAMPGAPDVRDARVHHRRLRSGARHDACAGSPRTPTSLFVQGFALSQYPFLDRADGADRRRPVLPVHDRASRADARAAPPPATPPSATEAAGILAVQNAQLDQGDFFICASEAQRDFWIGTLHSRGRINPRTYAADPTSAR